MVNDSFTAANGPHLGKNHGVYEGMHAMVLIGVRTLDDGCNRFLLQNWWANMPYVEVDIMYLISCQAEIHFITVPQLQVGDFDGTMADYAESAEGVDIAEQFSREG